MAKQPYIQAPVTEETFAKYNAHRKGLKQTWLEYLLGALAEYKASHPVPDASPEVPPSEGPASEQLDTAKSHRARKRRETK